MIVLEQIPLPSGPALAEGGSPLSLRISRGETVWVSGPAESGKTTLLEILALRRCPRGGRLSIMNYDAGPGISKRTRALLKRRISHVGPEPAFMDRLSLADNIALPLELAHFRKTDIRRETEAIIRWFGLERHMQDHPPTLSHIMRLRAACARALITQPSIILVDEPALTLCPALRHDLLETIRGLVANGASALLATQHPPGTMAAGERQLTLPARPGHEAAPNAKAPPAAVAGTAAAASPPPPAPTGHDGEASTTAAANPPAGPVMPAAPFRHEASPAEDGELPS